ncbi:MAG: nucleotide exchange factor GrpE [bacterium]|nr:nucleotide exchange factor GrpE [bacterium]
MDLKKKVEKAKKEAGKHDELEKLRKDLEEMTELAKRTMADMQNLKRRQEEERKLLITLANVDLLRQTLPILDNLDRASQHVPEGAEEWFKGVEMSINQLHQIYNELGLVAMETLNKPFDPDLHEALAQGPGEKDTVIEELEKGYMLGNKVIRHAKVKVGDGS